jgi:signal transduction histidine kinase
MLPAGGEPGAALFAVPDIGHAVMLRVTGLLDHDFRPGQPDAMHLIGELVARAGATGLAVSCWFSGATDGLPPAASDAAHRVVQEGLTNAFKDAPGAPVELTVTSSADEVEICVVNGPMSGRPLGLELTGSGRGLTGMRERVAASGGELAVGPAGNGGWQVRARLQLHQGRATARQF